MLPLLCFITLFSFELLHALLPASHSLISGQRLECLNIRINAGLREELQQKATTAPAPAAAAAPGGVSPQLSKAAKAALADLQVCRVYVCACVDVYPISAYVDLLFIGRTEDCLPEPRSVVFALKDKCFLYFSQHLSSFR